MIKAQIRHKTHDWEQPEPSFSPGTSGSPFRMNFPEPPCWAIGDF
jgi:hypothetical protein